MRLVAYVRVSQEDENPENQEYAIFRWAAQRGYQVVEIVRDVGVSGATSPAERPGWRRVLELLEQADGVVVYALDRVARSLWDLTTVVRELEGRGKVLLSVREEWLQQLDPKVRSLIVAVLGWAGEMEREFVRARTREALERARAQGKRIGRPPKWNETTRKKLVELVRKGVPLKDACKIAGVSYWTALKKLSRDEEYIKARVEARLRR